MLGKLTLAAIPLDQPVPLAAGGVVGVILLCVIGWIVVKGHLPYLWREWITSVDHKRVGIMYVILALIMLLRGFTDAIMMRTQQALAFNAPGFLPPSRSCAWARPFPRGRNLLGWETRPADRLRHAPDSLARRGAGEASSTRPDGGQPPWT